MIRLREKSALVGLLFVITVLTQLAIVTLSSSSAFAVVPAGSKFVPLQTRLLSNAAIGAGSSRAVQITNTAGIPASDVTAVEVTLTVASPLGNGLLNAAADGTTPPSVSYLNYSAGTTASNTSTIPVGSNGAIRVYASSAVSLTLDVQGYFVSQGSGGGYHPLSTPFRLIDSRAGQAAAAPLNPMGVIAAGSTRTIQASGYNGIPSGATAISVNFSVVGPTAAGSFNSYPADQAASGATFSFSNANVISVGTTVPLDSSGAFRFRLNGASANLVVDVVGFYTASSSGGSYYATQGRITDTRSSGSGGTANPIPANGFADFTVTAAAGIPSTNVGAVALHIATIPGALGGYLNVFPAGTSEPATSSMQYQTPAVTSNLVVSAVSATGQVRIANHGSSPVNIVIDAQGWYSQADGIWESGDLADQTGCYYDFDAEGMIHCPVPTAEPADVSSLNGYQSPETVCSGGEQTYTGESRSIATQDQSACQTVDGIAKREAAYVYRENATANHERVDLFEERITKVREKHGVNFTALVRVVESAHSPRMRTSNNNPIAIDRGVYRYKIYEYALNSSGNLEKTGRWCIVQFVIEWGDGHADRGWLVTAYPVATESGKPTSVAGKSVTPSWLRTAAVMGPRNEDILY